jgi:hypothetical protein
MAHPDRSDSLFITSIRAFVDGFPPMILAKLWGIIMIATEKAKWRFSPSVSTRERARFLSTVAKPTNHSQTLNFVRQSNQSPACQPKRLIMANYNK